MLEQLCYVVFGFGINGLVRCGTSVNDDARNRVLGVGNGL